ncbi:MAG: transglutaminase domain-containing protein [Oscillospiraceae bacterium]|nr:transglutaminase domain-containing protein [Oscillospiraceae bacterium]
MYSTDSFRIFRARHKNAFSALLILLAVLLLCGLVLFAGHDGPAYAADGKSEDDTVVAVTEEADAEADDMGAAEPQADADSPDPESEKTEEMISGEPKDETSEESTPEEPADETPAESIPEEPADETPTEPEEEPDTTPPVVKYAAAAVTLGENVTPSTFIIHYEDKSNVTLRFTEKPDTGVLGEYPVTIIAEDASGNRTVIKTTLYVCDSVVHLELEDRTYSGLRLRDKVGTLHGYHPSIDQYKVKAEGASSFELKKGDKVLYIGIQVRDTTRPTAKGVEQVCYLGYPKQPEEFVKNVSDYQDVTISFLTEPDWNEPGERDVAIALTDASYNRRIIKVKTVFKKDDVAPVLTSALSTYHYVGEAIAYKKGVVVTDNMDPNCKLTVDKSQVKYREVGTYPVTYTATDRDGNSSSLTVEITFREPTVSDEQLDQLAESVLGDILKNNMSTAEQIKAIYNYVRYKIRYTGDSDKTDWKGEAYRGLTEFKGDCFTYYSAAYLLLSKIDGVEIMSVERLGGRTHHYWCLVNIGTGWYHYDACPNHIYGTCFMRTSKQIQNGEGKVYWNFDTTLFPDVATKSFKMS